MKKILLFSLSFLFTLAVKGEQIHIQFDDTCLERLVYNIKSFNGKNFDLSGKYVSYRVKASASEFIYLNIGEESDELMRTAPKGMISCADINFNEDFVQKINAYSNEVFIVKQIGKKYSITPVQHAEYFFSFDDEITYADRDYGFNYNYELNDANTNLLTFGVKSKVTFSFRNDESCPSEYHFKRESRQKNQDNHGLVFVPDLGLIKKNFINRKTKKLEKQWELSHLNGVETMTYKEMMCGSDEEIKVVEAVSKKKKTANKDKVIEVAGLSSKTPAKPELAKAKTKKAPTAGVKMNPVAKGKGKAKQTLKTMALEEIDTTNTSVCNHIYKDLDKGGFYYDRNTGLPAEGMCGGITYTKGVMEGRDEEGDEILYTEAQLRDTLQSVLAAAQKQEVIYKDSQPKVIYKDPKIIYKEAEPIVINKTASVDVQKAIPATNQHLVKKGETLYALSKQYNVSIQDLRAWNNIDVSNSISIGTLLKVSPISFETAVPANDLVSKGNTIETPTHHIVSEGETLYAISKQYNTTVTNIKQFNGMITDHIKPGMRLKLVADKPVAAQKPAVIAPATPIIKVETPTTIRPDLKKATAVKKKETDIIISTEKAGEVTVEQPKEVLPPPAERIISGNTTSHTIHTVTESETIEIIAKKYNTSVEAIRKANNMEDGEVLIPFQKITIK